MIGHVIGRILAAVCTVALMYGPSIATAQERQPVELVSVDRETGTARIRVHTGGRVRDINRIARRYATTPGLHIDIDMIAEWNPNRIITVCYDQVPGERPYMSRNPEAWNACQHFPRARWLVAGMTYLVPLQPSDALAPVAAPTPSVSPTGPSARERALERRVAVAERELEEADRVILDSVTHEEALVARIEELDQVQAANRQYRTWHVAIAVLIAMIALCMVFYLLHKRWRTRVMMQVRRLNHAWSLYGLRLRKKLSLAEHEVGMLRRGITETSGELAQARTRQGQLRTRVQTLIVQLRENRNLLIAASQLIQEFQRRRQEDDDRRTRLPKLLKSLDDARLHRIYANNARARQDLVLDWVKLLRESANTYSKIMRRTLLGAYRRMLADYRRDRLYHEGKAALLSEDRTKAIEDLHALTGVRMESVDPEVRLKRSIDAADNNAGILEAKSRALDGLIATHVALQNDFSSREQAIVVREGQIAEAETELVVRMQAHEQEVAVERAKLEEELAQLGAAAIVLDQEKRVHQARVATWEKEHEVKKDLDVWSGGIAKAEATSKLSDVERRMSELEGTVRGLNQRDMETNLFLKEVQREFRRKSEIIEAIEKGPDYQAKLILQMTAYIHELEGKLGIARKSVFGELPAIGYGDAKPKGKA